MKHHSLLSAQQKVHIHQEEQGYEANMASKKIWHQAQTPYLMRWHCT